MNPNELMEIRTRGPKQKCIAKDCESCFHFRYFPAKDQGGKDVGLRQACSIEVLAVSLRNLIGAVEGAQQASNETRNAVFNFGAASVKTLDVISVQLDINRELLK